jgi:hypothetical protein
MEFASVPQEQLIDALRTLEPAPRAVLDLRYARRIPPATIAELLDRSPETVQELLEEGIEELALATGVESIDQGVTLVLLLTELPLSAWGNRSTAEVVALTRDELDRHGLSGAGGPRGHRARRVQERQETDAGQPADPETSDSENTA